MFFPNIPPIPPTLPPMLPVTPVFMPPPLGTDFLPTAWGSNVKFVSCTGCGHPFCYRMSRAVCTKNRERAQATVRKMLQLEFDPIPCPSCGCYQPEMIRLLKRRHCLALCLAGIGLLAAGIAACGVAFGVGLAAWPLVAVLPAIGLGMILLRLGLVRRFDPNAPAGTEARKAAGKQAEVVVPLSSSHPTAFVVAPDGTVWDVRYMNVQSLPAQ